MIHLALDCINANRLSILTDFEFWLNSEHENVDKYYR